MRGYTARNTRGTLPGALRTSSCASSCIAACEDAVRAGGEPSSRADCAHAAGTSTAGPALPTPLVRTCKAVDARRGRHSTGCTTSYWQNTANGPRRRSGRTWASRSTKRTSCAVRGRLTSPVSTLANQESGTAENVCREAVYTVPPTSSESSCDPEASSLQHSTGVSELQLCAARAAPQPCRMRKVQAASDARSCGQRVRKASSRARSKLTNASVLPGALSKRAARTGLSAGLRASRSRAP